MSDNDFREASVERDETGVTSGWARSAQDEVDQRDAADEMALPPREAPTGLDRRVGFVTVRWAVVLVAFVALGILRTIWRHL